jgi:16S rRNA (uracil1498-N3)-methyltransferase
MSLRSVYVEAPSFQNERLHLSGDEHRHLAVARAQRGEIIEVFDGRGNVWTAAIESVNKRETIALITTSRTVPPPSVELILGMALIRNAAFEFALEKAVEVGVTRIVPFTAARSNAAEGNRHDRWMRIVVEAAKQSKHYYLPRLESASSFTEVLSIPASSKIVFAERGGGPLKTGLAGSPALYLIGPEGGWTDEELAMANQREFIPVSLGGGILKAEMAAIVAAALICYELERGLKPASVNPMENHRRNRLN